MSLILFSYKSFNGFVFISRNPLREQVIIVSIEIKGKGL